MKSPVKIAINLFLILLVYLGVTNYSAPEDVSAACSSGGGGGPPPSGDSAGDCWAAGYGYGTCGTGDGDVY